MKEFEVTVRIRNNLLVERREALGLSAREASDKMGIAYTTLLDYESFRLNPLCCKEEFTWKKAPLKIAIFYGVSPEDLWPEAVLRVEKNRSIRKMGSAEMDLLIGASTANAVLPPSSIFEEKEQTEKVREMLNLLRPRERRMLERYYGIGCEQMTLEQNGASDSQPVGPARCGQIVAKAIRKLKHSNRSAILGAYGVERKHKFIYSYAPEFLRNWYQCSVCGKDHLCRKWKPTLGKDLFCRSCAEKRQGRGYADSLGTENEKGVFGDLYPAIPNENVDGFVGKSYITKFQLGWWKSIGD